MSSAIPRSCKAIIAQMQNGWKIRADGSNLIFKEDCHQTKLNRHRIKALLIRGVIKQVNNEEGNLYLLTEKGKRIDPAQHKGDPAEVRFWRFVVKSEKEDGCWEWIGPKNNKGYGRLGVNKKGMNAHRYSYEIHKGQIPGGYEIDHLCRNKACVNPSHLEAVTRSMNVLRALRKERYPNIDLCKRGHPRDGVNCYGARFCRECERIRLQKLYQNSKNKNKAQ